jgi:hypothetical protein
MNIRQFFGRLILQLKAKDRIVGWEMTPEEAIQFLKSRDKAVITLYGYSVEYQYKQAMLNIVREFLSEYSPQNTLVNSGATVGGVGAAYPLIKSMGFETAGIVSSNAIEHPGAISAAVDHVCFIKDEQWGGRLPDSNELSPTSKAMVACSDILVAIGGNDIARDELLAGQAQGKPVYYYPAEMDHKTAIQRAKDQGLPVPESFMGSVHDVFGEVDVFGEDVFGEE